MIKFLSCSAVAALLAIASACSSTSASKNPDPAKYEAEMQAKWMEFATPGPAHKALDRKVGNWDFTMKYWPTPDGPAQQATGTTEVAWIMERRYLEDHTHSAFDGMPFDGRGITGYDNMTDKYRYTWFDNMGTGFSTGDGTFDPATKTFKWVTMGPNVMTGEYCKSWATEKFIDDDHWVSEMYGPGPDGENYKMMEMTFTRAR